MNRFSEELSPYLKTHKSDPIEWYSWSDETFEKAIREEKLIFLSIGYSSCYLCYMMKIESFQNLEIAKALNRDFISIKVDKEERPDIDNHFQNVFLEMQGKFGGWPLSIFMTPDKIPIFTTTYIPSENRYGAMGFGRLLDIVIKNYKIDKEKFLKKGREVIASLGANSYIKATKITQDITKIAASQIKSLYDRENGGFGKAPKSPRVSALMLSLSLYEVEGDRELLDIVTSSVDKMSIGGFYDLVDGGYHRYSKDDIWLIPHFGKVSYENALLIELLNRLYDYTRESRYLQLAMDTADFLISKMSKDGLFFTAIDPIYGKVIEGEYFIFDYDEAVEAFKSANIDSGIVEKLNITKEGNFEGSNIVRLDLWRDFKSETVRQALGVLRAIREKREYPNLDKRVLTSWNAMVIKALFELGENEERYAEIAKESLDKLTEQISEDGRVYRTILSYEKSKINSFLEDYIYLALSAVKAYKNTLDIFYLNSARSLADYAIEKFYRDGKWCIADGEFKDFVDDFDTSRPSEIGVVVELLMNLKDLVDEVYDTVIKRTFEVHSYELMRQPLSRAKLTEMVVRYNNQLLD